MWRGSLEVIFMVKTGKEIPEAVITGYPLLIISQWLVEFSSSKEVPAVQAQVPIL